MELTEAKKFYNRTVVLTWLDRTGNEITDEVFVFEVGFVPMYGQCMVTTKGEIRLDRVVQCSRLEKKAA